ncbi:hypothetical protein PR048_002510 [Dryococelus australis]|uniref:HAT C-terminal dimerisation domain-containing protein n=1 Tax=Dryococelus australis TaxID=614101 RepID=A0ABQ9IKH2_9NEOP|nr:hypothetical protein PR048_002510 [Dryococelus australis]
MEQRRNARSEEREIPAKTRRPTASSRRPGTKIRVIPPGGKESHIQSPNAENRSAETRDSVLDLDPTPGMVAVHSVNPVLYFALVMLVTALMRLPQVWRQEISLRGHRDSGRLNVEEPTKNDGNFRALLRLRARAGDSLLNEHLNSERGNAMYISPTVQNGLLSLIGKQIQETVAERIKEAKFFTILGDENTDISRVEQFSLCVKCLEMDIFDMRGFSDIRSGRTKILKDGLEAAGIPNCAVHNYNDTRWVERHDCVAVFSESFLSIVQALELLIERGLAIAKIEHVERMISEIRENCEKEFAVVYRNAQDKAPKVGVLASFHEGLELSDSEIMWKKAHPRMRKQFIDIEKAIEFYKDDLQYTNRSILEAEWRLWKMSSRTPERQTQATKVMTVCEVLKIIDKDSFPNMAVLLKILAVIPLTTASVERSFSTLKRLKTCLRNKTGEERLTALTLMTVHRDVKVHVEDIVKQYGQISRRLSLS